jgi:putative ABC transport system permease protein
MIVDDRRGRSRGNLATLRPSLRDLQWRRRRFAVAVVGAGMLFGLTLSTTGISSGFGVEVDRTVRQLRVDQWIVHRGAVGPFLGSSPMAASRLDDVAHLPGITRAVDTVYTRKDITTGGDPKDVNVFGAPAGTLAMPAVSSGRAPARAGEIAISTKLDYPIGARLVLAGHPFTVVGKVSLSTALAGVPNVFLTLPDAQLVAFNGKPVASAIAVRGNVRRNDLPPDLAVVSNHAARDDLLRALKQARASIYLTAALSWLVAAMIIGSVIYLSVIERLRDFAVFKAIGVSTRSILGGLAIQAVLLSIGAAVIGSGVAAVLGPNLSLPVSISWRAYLLLPVIAVVVGLLASIAGLRRAVTVDPATAFGGP